MKRIALAVSVLLLCSCQTTSFSPPTTDYAARADADMAKFTFTDNAKTLVFVSYPRRADLEQAHARERIALATQIGAAQGDGDHFRAAGVKGVAHRFRRREFSRAHDEPRPESPPGDGQWLI